MPFLGSFTGSKAFGGGGGGGSLSVWLSDEGFSLVSGTAGQASAVYEKVYEGKTGDAYNITQSDMTYTLSAPPVPVSAQVAMIAGGGGSTGGIAGGGGAGGS